MDSETCPFFKDMVVDIGVTGYIVDKECSQPEKQYFRQIKEYCHFVAHDQTTSHVFLCCVSVTCLLII